ncbi:MAG TPA: hypothetical protein DCQ06_08105 [Myxococcales bacterium]|nr:hypothetical protein [Myxococcales bacterium]
MVQASAAPMARGGGGLREAIGGVQGYEAQRAMVSPSAQDGSGAPTSGAESPAGGMDAAGLDAAMDGAGQETAMDGAGQEPAMDGAGQDTAVDGAGQEPAVDGAGQEPAMDDGQSAEAGADSNAGMIAAGPNRGGGKRRAKSRRGKRNRAKWPQNVPIPPVYRVWKEYGPNQANPRDWCLKSNDNYVGNEAREHNKWLSGLSKQQLDAARLYRYCKVGAADACRKLEAPMESPTASPEQIRAIVDKAIGDINTVATRVGAAAAMVDKAMDKAGVSSDLAKLKKASGVLSRTKWALRGLTSLLGDVTTGAGLYTDALALASAAVDLTTKGVTDETLKAVWGAAGVLLKDAAIAFVPPPIGLTLTIANGIMCEIEPKWVEKTVGLFFNDSPAPKPKAQRAPPPTSKGKSIANKINWR